MGGGVDVAASGCRSRLLETCGLGVLQVPNPWLEGALVGLSIGRQHWASLPACAQGTIFSLHTLVS